MTRRSGRYGRKFNRASVTLSKVAAQPAMPNWFEKTLGMLLYTISNPKLIRNFQADWNEVRKAGMIQGPALGLTNSADVPTQKAAQSALNFQKSMPNGWIYYVKKARYINGQNEPQAVPETQPTLPRPGKHPAPMPVPGGGGHGGVHPIPGKSKKSKKTRVRTFPTKRARVRRGSLR